MSSCNIVKVYFQVSLTYFDHKKETVVLMHEGFKNVAFSHRALTDTEKRYANIEREMLAVVVVVACENFHSYLFGRVRSETS